MENLSIYYYEHAGQQAGPVAAAQLLACGVRATTRVWQEGLADWVPAASVPALAALFEPPLFPPTLPQTKAVPAVSAPVPVASPSPISLTSEPIPVVSARPEFSAEASKHKWWHYLIRVLVGLLLMLLIRACGTVIIRAISVTAPTPPSQPVAAVVSPNSPRGD